MSHYHCRRKVHHSESLPILSPALWTTRSDGEEEDAADIARSRCMKLITEFNEHFDMRRVCTYFEQSLQTSPFFRPNTNEVIDATLIDYVHGCREANKMLPLFGISSSFVRRDVDDKAAILQKCIDDQKRPVRTLFELVSMNTNDGKAKPTSGSGTIALLYLNRALEYVIELVREVRFADDSVSVAQIASESYERTLGKYHSWPVRYAVAAAVKMLSDRRTILCRLFDVHHGKFAPKEECEMVMDRLVVAAQQLHDVAATILKQHNCNDIS